MSLLRYKQKLLPYGSPMGGGDGGGGGGGGQPTQTTSYNTNIPEYAKPYVTGMLEATQKQIYNDDRTSFRPYTPYSTDVNNYFAGFSPLQQQAQYESARMQQPGQFALGSGLAGAGGVGSLGLAGQAAGLGGQYAQMAQDPRAMQGYMSPYMQNVVDYQKSQALRDYQIASPMRARQAVGAGAFGGSRQAIMEAEAQRSLGSQLQGITATGSQKAFEDAQRQQQFGAQLGLQGLQTGLQGLGQVGQMGATLGQLGAQQQAADIARQNQMSAMGKQQQDLEQQKINQAIQNYAIQQQYPMMQLGFMSNMLRGLPLQAQTTQLYQAQPSTTQQAVGLLGAGASLFGRKEGGAIKEYREGGIASAYKYGGAISDPELEAMADRLSVAQLQERLRDPQLTPGERQIFSEALQEKKQEKDRMSGIALAGGPAFDSQGAVTAAGGGIIAFAGEGPSLVEEDENKVMSFEERLQRAAAAPKKPFQYDSLASKLGQFPSKLGQFQSTKKQEESPIFTGNTEFDLKRQAEMEEQDVQKELGVDKILAKKEEKGAAKEGTAGRVAPEIKKEKTLADYLAERKALGPKGQVGEEFEKYLTERLGKQTERSAAEERERRAKFFLEMGGDPMGYLSGARKGAMGYIADTAAGRKAQDAMEGEAQKARMELEKARRAEERGDIAGAQEARDKAIDHDLKRQQIAATGATAGAATRFEKEAIERVMAENPNMKFAEALQLVRGAGRFETTEVQKAKAALASIDDRLGLMGKKDPRRAELEAQRAEIIRLLTPGGGVGGGQTAQNTGTGVLRFDAQGNLIKG
jgi:hypothetical protein